MKIVNLALCMGLSVIGCSAKDGGAGDQPGGPVVLASGQTNPWSIAIDNDNVYWINSGTLGGVYKVAKTGGPVTELYRGEMNDIVSFGVDSTSVYFPTNEGIMAAPIGGGPTRLVSPGGAIGVVVANGRVYWAEGGGGSNPTVVKSAPTGGGTPTSMTWPGSALSAIMAGAGTFGTAASDAVYIALDGQGGIVRIPFDQGPLTTLNANVALNGALGADSANVFFRATDTLDVVGKGGGNPVHLTAAPPIGGLVVDESFVYFYDNGGIARLPKAGGPTAVVVTGSATHTIAMDAKNLYWNDLSGTIMRAAK
jgi:hypothetical protein